MPPIRSKRDHSHKAKVFRAPLQLKAGADQGRVSALFSVFNVIDSSNEVVMPSFFTDGQVVPMAAWGHSWASLPVGKGVIRVTPEGAVFEGEFFLSTAAGREHYETIKAMGETQEWSWGFSVLEAEPGTFDGRSVTFLKRGEVYEVSPVLVGDNRETQTLAIKSAPTIDVLAEFSKAQRLLADAGIDIRTRQPIFDADAEYKRSQELLAPSPKTTGLEKWKHIDGTRVQEASPSSISCEQKELVAFALDDLKSSLRLSPRVKWFVPDIPYNGFADAEERTIWVSAHLTGWDLLHTLGHEAKHLDQERGRDGSYYKQYWEMPAQQRTYIERQCDDFALEFARRVSGNLDFIRGVTKKLTY